MSSKKDYAAAFGNLQSKFGAGGHTPCQPPTQSSHSQPHTHPSSQQQPANQYLKNEGGKEKDYASAFASLQTQFGAGGHTPYHPNVGYDKPKPKK